MTSNLPAHRTQTLQNGRGQPFWRSLSTVGGRQKRLRTQTWQSAETVACHFGTCTSRALRESLPSYPGLCVGLVFALSKHESPCPARCRSPAACSRSFSSGARNGERGYGGAGPTGKTGELGSTRANNRAPTSASNHGQVVGGLACVAARLHQALNAALPLAVKRLRPRGFGRQPLNCLPVRLTVHWRGT